MQCAHWHYGRASICPNKSTALFSAPPENSITLCAGHALGVIRNYKRNNTQLQVVKMYESSFSANVDEPTLLYFGN